MTICDQDPAASPTSLTSVAQLLSCASNGSAHMNPFTADHPLASKSSWFDTREHQVLSFVCSTSVVALILTPFVLHHLYGYAIRDVGAEPNPFLESWWALCWALFWGGLIAF